MDRKEPVKNSNSPNVNFDGVVMETMEAITSRRSIRQYTDDEVSKEIIEELLVAAMSAPSAGNQQPWHFIIIKDPKILNAIPKFHPYSQMLKDTPVAIMVCGDMELEKHRGYWVQDCSAATQNILLAAHSIGLGAVWLGIYPGEERVSESQQLLGLPKNVIPLSLISIGYPAEEKQQANRYNSSRVHYEHW